MDDTPHQRQLEAGTLMARARQARSAAEDVVAHSAALEMSTRERVASCLAIRDRVADVVWALDLETRNQALSRSLARSRRRYAGMLGRAPEIERAQRLIVERYGCSPSEAFRLMRSLSQRTNRKLAAVAASIVEDERDAGPRPRGR